LRDGIRRLAEDFDGFWWKSPLVAVLRERATRVREKKVRKIDFKNPN